MTIGEALKQAAHANGWSPAKIAGEVGTTETSVRSWLSGASEPRASTFILLRHRVPGFAALVDRIAA